MCTCVLNGTDRRESKRLQRLICKNQSVEAHNLASMMPNRAEVLKEKYQNRIGLPLAEVLDSGSSGRPGSYLSLGAVHPDRGAVELAFPSP